MTKPVRQLTLMLAEDKREFVAILIYSFIHSVLFLAVPLAAQALVNVVVSGLYLQPLIVLTCALFLGLAAAGVLTLVRFWLVEVMRERIFARVALRVAERLPRVSHRSLAENNGPELMNRFFDVINIQKSWFKLAYEGPGAATEILVGLTLLGVYGTELFGLASGFLATGILLFVIAGYGGLRTSISESSQKYRVAEWLEEMVRCQDSLKVNSRLTYWAEETDRRVVGFIKERRSHFWILMRQKTLFYILAAFSVSGLLGMGGYLVIQGRLTLGQLVAAELVVWGLLKAVQKLVGLTESLFDLLTGLTKVSAITALPVDTPGQTHIPVSDRGAEVLLDGVQFGYDPAVQLISSLDLKVESGEWVTILGEDGSGKSTLISLIANFLKPNIGSIEVDMIDLREVHPESFAESVAIISPQADLFAGTLFDNVACGRQVDMHSVKETLELCGGRQILRNLPQGVHSYLTCTGRTLSATERAAVLLARALVNSPRLLLLDGAFHQLSQQRQATLAKNLRARLPGCTIISTLALPYMLAASDRIFEMTEKKLEPIGGPSDLVKSNRPEYEYLIQGLALALKGPSS
jgi:ATP-binding cassette, subfamily B, bacterial